ncbi:unnamed protein product [Protopolystoma xenopodis]|uniref:Uncharacterized protein n=1 Tax=Protopolystoma xenopodis TaxID=117903 RepID=A0A3S5FG49_9PLAT|nr:unnamed protein product [Protopolystoma xenopodis]
MEYHFGEESNLGWSIMSTVRLILIEPNAHYLGRSSSSVLCLLAFAANLGSTPTTPYAAMETCEFVGVIWVAKEGQIAAGRCCGGPGHLRKFCQQAMPI